MRAQGRGCFITLEGGEGGGKSTQARRLADALKKSDIDVVLTREPGGSPGAEQIRALLVDGEVHRWDALTEALLHFAARRDHLLRTVLPALERGAWVISDRFVDSTIAYQGYGHGLDLAIIDALTRMTVGSAWPDLTLILDLPVEAGLARAGSRGAGEDRYERMETPFHQRIRDGFLEIARKEPGRCAVIDAGQDEQSVHIAILQAVEAHLAVGIGE